MGGCICGYRVAKSVLAVLVLSHPVIVRTRRLNLDTLGCRVEDSLGHVVRTARQGLEIDLEGSRCRSDHHVSVHIDVGQSPRSGIECEHDRIPRFHIVSELELNSPGSTPA